MNSRKKFSFIIKRFLYLKTILWREEKKLSEIVGFWRFILEKEKRLSKIVGTPESDVIYREKTKT